MLSNFTNMGKLVKNSIRTKLIFLTLLTIKLLLNLFKYAIKK
jgi:hypothetical protein